MLILKPLDSISGHTNIGAMLLPNNGCHRNIDNMLSVAHQYLNANIQSRFKLFHTVSI